MARTKKDVTVNAPAKAEVKVTPETKTTAAKVVEAKTAETTKKENVEKKAPVKKAVEKKTTAKTTKKVAVKETINVQFAGKSYTTEDLVKIAKDVWKYDLRKKVSDFKSVELYVKPEEGLTYYVINGEVSGSFTI